MIRGIVLAFLTSFALSWIMTWGMKHLAPKIGFVDKPGGRKIHANPKALGGGVAIFWAIAIPLLGMLAAARLGWLPQSAQIHVAGMAYRMPLILSLLGALLAMHVMGLIDDHKAMGAYPKLLVQLAATSFLVLYGDVRVATMLGYWPSAILSILWIVGITNAFNFMDNMDGLSAGVAAVCAVPFLIATVLIGQWFVAGTLALLLGALVGFLCFNFAPATIFMGDSGSLVVGMLMGFLTVRTTYLVPGHDIRNNWYSLLMPLLVLAVPLYDLVVVSIIRISHGKSPFVGDTNHLSHRLVRRGMSRRTAVLCIWLITAATGVAAVLLPRAADEISAILLLAQTVLVLCVVALLEQHPLPDSERA